MPRVQTQGQGGSMLFTLDDGTQAIHPQEFIFKGIDYYLLGGVYYELEQQLINKIFKEPHHEIT
jgi:hypothetical protein